MNLDSINYWPVKEMHPNNIEAVKSQRLTNMRAKL